MPTIDFKKFVKEFLSTKKITESGYSGQGHGTGAISFHGTYYGFGGKNQLATDLTPSVKKLKKQRDKEAIHNIEDQMKINRGYPASKSVSGFPGGESGAGQRSGTRIPNTINQIALSVHDLDKFDIDNPTKQYWGFSDDDEEEKEDDDEIIEALGAGGGSQGPQRSVSSDGNYRDLPGYPRHNSIEKPVDFIPPVENDFDGDGEEDEYLTDEEYVNDVLRLNGMDVRPERKKKLFGPELGEGKLNERTLYHGTVNDHLDSVKKYGLIGDIGDWVKDAYGLELDEEEWEEHLGNITFAADKKNIDAATGAIRYHVGKKLGKWLTEVDEEDIKEHGMLVVIRDVEEPKKIKYPEDAEEEGEWFHRPTEDEDHYGAYPMSVEPGDWFIKGGAGIDDVLVGNKLIQFLRRMNGLKQVKTDTRRILIKLMIAVHGPKERNFIVSKVKKIPDNELQKYINKYEKEGREILLKRRKEQAEKQRSPQLSLGFENKLSLKNVFKEAYNPEPNRGVERYKQGKYLRDDEPDTTKKIIKYVDYSDGHQSMPSADETPNQRYGVVGWPKKFVPDDWEQRSRKTKSIDDDRTMNEKELKEFVRSLVKEAIEEVYTGIDDETGEGEPKGGSAAFEQSRKKVITYDKKHRPSGPEDLKNYHME